MPCRGRGFGGADLAASPCELDGLFFGVNIHNNNTEVTTVYTTMPLPGFKMANELKVAESVTTMTNNGVGEARPKLARKQPSRCKKDDADQGSSPSSGKRPTCCGGDDEDNKKARAGTQSSPGKNNNNKGSRRDDAVVRDGNTINSSAVDAAAGGLDHITVGGNGGRDMYKNKNESASADRERDPVEAGRSSPVR